MAEKISVQIIMKKAISVSIKTPPKKVFTLQIRSKLFGQGPRGDSVELRATEFNIQWKYLEGEERFDLISLAEITGADGENGREVELGEDGENLLWRYVGDTAWQILLPIDEIVPFYLSSGLTTVPSFVDNGDGTCTVGNCTCNLFETPDFSGKIKSFSIVGGVFSITDGAEEYIAIKYNAGSPIMYKESVKENINCSDSTIAYTVWRQGNILHSVDKDTLGEGLANKLCKRIDSTEPYKRTQVGGLELGETSTPVPRTITVSPANVYAGAVLIDILAFNSSVDLLTKATVSNGVRSYDSSQDFYSNNQYNPASGPAVLPVQKFTCIYFYRSIGDTKETFWAMSANYYSTSAQAQSDPQPNVSFLLRDHCMLIGRIIIKSGDASGIVQTAFANQFNTTNVINHNDTANIQGGVPGEYLHLSLAEYNELAYKSFVIETAKSEAFISSIIFG